jgi:hypothetical protein
MDVFGTLDIGRQFGVTLCGASVAGGALQTFLLHSLSLVARPEHGAASIGVRHSAA